jgi:hypothetical protein
VAGIEEQLKRIGAASSLRQPTPVAELRERASHIRKNRRRLTSGLLIFVAIIIFLVPLPQLHLLHGSTTSGRKTGSTIGPVGAGIPVLGEPTGAFAQGDGFGEVRPSRIYSGGDSGESLSGVVWKSWGGVRAVGSGLGKYNESGGKVGTGSEELATIVAFKLGTCHGKVMYQALEWFFPQYGQRFSPNQYENICSGTYVGRTSQPPACLSNDLTARRGPQISPATGEAALVVDLTNAGPGSCVLDGYPRVFLLAREGNELSLAQVNHSQFITAAAPRPLTLAPGATAYVAVAKYRCDLGDLQVASRVRLMLPGSGPSTALTISLSDSTASLSSCNGGSDDPGNVVAVSPFEPSLDATNP